MLPTYPSRKPPQVDDLASCMPRCLNFEHVCTISLSVSLLEPGSHVLRRRHVDAACCCCTSPPWNNLIQHMRKPRKARKPAFCSPALTRTNEPSTQAVFSGRAMGKDGGRGAVDQSLGARGWGSLSIPRGVAQTVEGTRVVDTA